METDEEGQRNIQHAGTRTRRLAAAAVLATAVLGGTAACASSSSSPAGLGGGTSSAGAGLSTTATSTQPAAPSTITISPAATTASPSSGAATSTAKGSGSGSSSSSGSGSGVGSHAVSGGTASCTGSEIKVTPGLSDAAMSHDGYSVVFTNTSSRTCTLQGYPGAAVMDGSTVVLNATRSLNGYIGDERDLSSAPLVTLVPGGKASAMLESLANAGETCYRSGTGTLEVTPPNTTATTGLVKLTVGSGGICAGFEVHPVVAGVFN